MTKMRVTETKVCEPLVFFSTLKCVSYAKVLAVIFKLIVFGT